MQGRNHTLHKDVFVTADVTVYRTDPLGAIFSEKNVPSTQNAMAVDALQAV